MSLGDFTGTHADLDALSGIASRLRNGAQDLDSMTAPPPAPVAGESTEAIAGAMAMLTISAAEIVEILNGMGDAVAHGRDVYDDTDAGTIKDLSRLGEITGEN
ncbi:hypothetical protein GIY23_08380 [Allosaccharopolyspora coralli]|uniref:Uncharacterized protein n=1 Tax=Allosaccharopolyspora coralli TaxID=2665642 RepID=A0A5Q3QDA6_9PSEU|nr:hypothetical protein [Allosaccharopolyspora coralli]QGK69539.1 hypothetical protein GIY23_08380 [Allosaccharopolyspora coralli]